MKGKLFTFNYCKEMTLENQAEAGYTLKLTFENRFQNAVTMYSSRLIQYFKLKKTQFSMT